MAKFLMYSRMERSFSGASSFMSMSEIIFVNGLIFSYSSGWSKVFSILSIKEAEVSEISSLSNSVPKDNLRAQLLRQHDLMRD